MKAQRKRALVPVAEYLEAEERAAVKHEYVDGVVYAMVGGRIAHDIIATNILVALGSRLVGRACRPYSSDMKVRINQPDLVRFYYPDAQVVCRSNKQDEAFQDHPVAIFEVLSKRTRRADEGEKKDAYLKIPSLALYVLVEQTSPALVAYRRARIGFSRELREGLDAVLPMPELQIELPLAEIFRDVDFNPGRLEQRLR